MTKIFHPISEQEALAELPRLRQRLTTKARHSSCLRGTEGKTLLAQAKRALRWHQLFLSINQRACQ
ncbi:hypothetical protein [Aeromonas hydrophila]|uniref:hypothetical protein n=1 Tax=Aeromonas hydrophila TaxID=644 RepID=UPI001933147E|nr:hypothetical protein [Aeromonas hydrophila]MBM0511617.1 hypothetical protein [Aeromonas hydrophila]MBW3771633.1 hypothetical protein [Aeromonas hydrophila]